MKLYKGDKVKCRDPNNPWTIEILEDTSYSLIDNGYLHVKYKLIESPSIRIGLLMTCYFKDNTYRIIRKRKEIKTEVDWLNAIQQNEKDMYD